VEFQKFELLTNNRAPSDSVCHYTNFLAIGSVGYAVTVCHHSKFY